MRGGTPEVQFRAGGVGCQDSWGVICVGEVHRYLCLPRIDPTRSRQEAVLMNEAVEDLGSS